MNSKTKSDETKLVRINRTTYEKLAERGKWNDTMDEIVERLLDDSANCRIAEEE